MQLSSIDLLVVGFAFLVLYRLSRSTKALSNLQLPPGPPGLPIIGNLLDIPSKESWLVYRQMAEEYGSDLVRLRTFGRDYVIINSLEVANDLFYRRSAIYNDRPELTMARELVGYDWAMPFLPYEKRLKDVRTAFHQGLGSKALEKYTDIQESAVRHLLVRLRSSPELFLEHIRHMSGRIIIRLAYGIQVKEKNDPYIAIAEEGFSAFNSVLSVGPYWVDTIPILKYVPAWFPGAEFQRQAKRWRTPVTAMVELPFQAVKEQMDSSLGRHLCAATSLYERLMDNVPDPAYTESVIKASLGSMYLGGADTTLATVSIFVLAMVLYPGVQVKAQEEIDRVIGTGRFPDLGDQKALPYLEAIVRETFRWHPIAPINTPHRLSQDDEYNGYFLRKGTTLLVNNWAILHDPEVYPDPEVFKPERFLKDGLVNPTTQDPSVACFGFGRRICPGRFLARESVWIAIASLLATYKFSKAIGPDGQEITPREHYSSSLVSYPEPFTCDIRPRSAESEALIMACTIDE